jgi:FAD dependent monooxygenase
VLGDFCCFATSSIQIFQGK